MNARVLLVATLLLLVSCTGDNRRSVKPFDAPTRPTWVDDVPRSEGDFVYEVGIAEEELARDVAEEKAYLNACGKLASRISAGVTSAVYSVSSRSGAPNVSIDPPRTRDAGSQVDVTTRIIAEQLLVGAVREKTHLQKFELSRPVPIHLNTDPDKLRWGAYVLVKFPREELDRLQRLARVDSTTRGRILDDEELFLRASEDAQSVEPEKRDTAVRTLRSLHTRHPDNAKYTYGLGLSLLALGQPDEARALFRGLVQGAQEPYATLAKGQLTEMERAKPASAGNQRSLLLGLRVSLTADGATAPEGPALLRRMLAELESLGATLTQSASGADVVAELTSVEMGPVEKIGLGDHMVLKQAAKVSLRATRGGVISDMVLSEEEYGADAEVLSQRLAARCASALARRIRGDAP